MKTLIICRDEPRHIAFANRMETCSDVQALVIQRGKPFSQKLSAWKPLRRKVDETWKYLRHLFLQRVSREKRFFYPDSEPQFDHTRRILETFNNNSEDVQALVRDTVPDLVLTFGCSILKKDAFFDVPKVGIVNLHSGIVPDYRGVDNVYWCLYNQEPHRIGATIHYIDRTIDTGSYLAHVFPPVELGDDEYSLFSKTIKYGIDAFAEIMTDFDKAFGKLEGKLQDHKGHLYQEKHRNFFTDLKVFQYLRNPGLCYTRSEAEIHYFYKRP